MARLFLIIFLGTLLAMAFWPSETSSSRPHIEIVKSDVPVDTSHAPKFDREFQPQAALLDYPGTYRAYLPCANCEATEITLTLRPDRTFSRTIIQVGLPDGTYGDEGDFSWDETGTRIILNVDANTKYLYHNDKLYQLGPDGTQCMSIQGKDFVYERI